MSAPMKLEKASTAALVIWILVATACFALYVTIFFASKGGFGLIPIALFLIAPLAMLVTAWQIDDLKGPILETDDRGMTICPVFAKGERIPWSDIEDVKITSWYYNFFFRVPWMSWLVIHLKDSSHIGGLQWFLPPAWFGRIAIPTRFVKGGTKAARSIVRASQGGLLDGEVARERKTAGTDAILARGDAAIQRALQARGGASSFQSQPRTMADLADRAEAAAPLRSRPIPQGYDAPAPTVPASATAPQIYWEDVPQVPDVVPQPTRPPADPTMTIQQPAPIMVNGVPYQPKPVGGGFGRRRN
jgi:hypothetical protein